MAVVNPLAKEQAAAELHELYDAFSRKYGHVPGIAAVMAHLPPALKSFEPLYSAIMAGGTIEPRYKELAYLKTSALNGCEY
jgi:alkylhydroperoxidase family enzyme